MALSKTREVPAPSTSRRAHWQAQLEACRRSGLSQAEFCRRRGIAPGTLAFWKHVLARERRATRSRSHPAAPAAPTFVPVRVVTRPEPRRAAIVNTAAPGRSALEIVLVGGRRVRVRERVDVQWLAQVVRTLETLGC